MSQDARLLQAGAVFSERCDNLQDLRHRGTFTGVHSIVARGPCGPPALRLGATGARWFTTEAVSVFGGAASFTMMCWFRTDTIISYPLFAEGTGYAGIDMNMAGLLGAVVGDTVNTFFSAGTTSVNDSVWRHGAMVVNRATNLLTLYIDGVAEGTPTDITILGVVDLSTYLDSLQGPGGTHLDTANWAIFARALSAAEIFSLARGTVWTYDRTLVSEWDMSTV